MAHLWSLLLLISLLAFRGHSTPAPISFGPASSGLVGYSFPAVNVRALNSDSVPEPIESSLRGSTLSGQNTPLELQSLDLLSPPPTDNENIANLKWPFSMSHMRLEDGGWARQQTAKQMPIATDLAGVNMRLQPGAIRELHWHTANEWAYVLEGDVRVSIMTPEGLEYVGDVTKGDICACSKNVLAKNFGTGDDTSAFDRIPEKELYIFQAAPPPDSVESDWVIPNDTENPYTFALSKTIPTKTPGGSIKRIDSASFEVAKKISAVEVTVKVEGMRELHWHPTQPEWTYFISGNARVTVFAAYNNAQTYDFQAGDVVYIPPSFGHYVENTGKTDLKSLEVFKSALAQDISLTQWLALTPHELVKAHLGFSDDFVSKLNRGKLDVV